MGHHHDEAEDEQIPFRLEGAAGTGHHVLVTRAKRHWLDEHLERQWRRPPTSRRVRPLPGRLRPRGDPVPRGARPRARPRRPGRPAAPGPEDGDAGAPRCGHDRRVRPHGPLPRPPGGLHPPGVGLVPARLLQHRRSGCGRRAAAAPAALGEIREAGASPGRSTPAIRRRCRARSATGRGPWWRAGSGRGSRRRSSRLSRAPGPARSPRRTATTWCSWADDRPPACPTIARGRRPGRDGPGHGATSRRAGAHLRDRPRRLRGRDRADRPTIVSHPDHAHPRRRHRHEERTPSMSASENPQRDPYFGELHVHTAWSLDAFVLAVAERPRRGVPIRQGRDRVTLVAQQRRGEPAAPAARLRRGHRARGVAGRVRAHRRPGVRTHG